MFLFTARKISIKGARRSFQLIYHLLMLNEGHNAGVYWRGGGGGGLGGESAPLVKIGGQFGGLNPL